MLKTKDEETSPRDRILETLKRNGPQTARELAKVLGGGLVAMRAQLRYLHAAGLVARAEERQIVGRPVRRFHLTAAADALFTKHYGLFAIRLVEAIVAEFGEGALEKVLSHWEDELCSYLAELLPKDADARLEALAAHQSKFGFMASIQKDEQRVAVVERNCPIMEVAARFPQICLREASLFRRTLNQSIVLARCQARGDLLCAFELAREEVRNEGELGP